MIIINSKIKKNIANKIKLRFNIREGEARLFTKKIINSLEGSENVLIYEVQHLIYHHNSIEFSNNILQSSFEIYIYLSSSTINTDKKNFFNHFFYGFIETLYSQKYQELVKKEKRDETVQNILKHVSRHLNNRLETQQLMIANISHEMRTALNAIKSYNTLISDSDILSGKENSYLKKAIRSTNSLNALVSDILDISKINSGQMEIKSNPFWLDETILNSLDSIIMNAHEKKLELITDISFSPYKMIGDSQRIMEIIVNLLSNAIKFTDKGSIDFTVTQKNISNTNIEILFKIKDTGIGISEENIKTLFDPYTRFKKEVQGVGLGLHISSSLAKKMNGNLRVESKEKEGSTFFFNIILKIDKDSNISFQDKTIYFFNDKNNTEYGNIYRHQINFLKDLNATIKEFSDEEKFIGSLLGLKNNIPHIISIKTYSKSYAKYDGLIHYLKSTQKFKKTYFIAEGTKVSMPLKYFDTIFERFSTVSLYITAIKKFDNQVKNINNPDKEKNIKILAVDDIETNLDILKVFITNRFPDIKLDIALGGYEAIGMYKTNNYKLIFLDLKMPGLDGFKTLEKFKDVRELPQVYALTADIYKDTFDRVMKSGFTGMHEKPIKPNLLFKTIEEVIYAI